VNICILINSIGSGKTSLGLSFLKMVILKIDYPKIDINQLREKHISLVSRVFILFIFWFYIY
jgi:hypothetical protein